MSFPTRVSPMLAQSGQEPFDSESHVFEIKWDGIRCITLIDPNGAITLQSRNLKDITERFPEFADLPRSCRQKGIILDGELVVLDSEQKPSFSSIQRRVRSVSAARINTYYRSLPATYMIFDLLYFNNHELYHLPLKERKELLASVLTESQYWVISHSVSTLGKTYAKVVFDLGLEGVMAKDLSSPYLPGKRSEYWLKIKNQQNMVATIVGFTAPDRASTIDALVLAHQEDEKLRYVGRVGTGFSYQEGAKLLKLLTPLLIASPPVTVPVHERGSWWVRPSYKCKVQYLEFTPDGVLRHAVYKGLKEDVH